MCGIEDQTGVDIDEFWRVTATSCIPEKLGDAAKMKPPAKLFVFRPLFDRKIFDGLEAKKSSFVLNLPWSSKLSFLKQSLIANHANFDF